MSADCPPEPTPSVPSIASPLVSQPGTAPGSTLRERHWQTLPVLLFWARCHAKRQPDPSTSTASSKRASPRAGSNGCVEPSDFEAIEQGDYTTLNSEHELDNLLRPSRFDPTSTPGAKWAALTLVESCRRLRIPVKSRIISVTSCPVCATARRARPLTPHTCSLGCLPRLRAPGVSPYGYR